MYNINHCFICKQALNVNEPLEHIFLHGLGDTLKSRHIICGRCNHILGQMVDYPLVKDMSKYTNIKGITNGSVIFKGYNNKEYIYDSKKRTFNLKHPYVNKPLISEKGHKRQIKINSEFPAPSRFKHIDNYQKCINNYVTKMCLKYHIPRNKFPKPQRVIEKVKGHKRIKFHPLDYVFELHKMATEFALLCGVSQDCLKLEQLLFYLIVRTFDSGASNLNSLKRLKYLLFLQDYITTTKVKHPNNNLPPDSRHIRAKLFTRNVHIYCWISLFGLLNYTILLNIQNRCYKNFIYYYNGNVNDFRKHYPELE